MLLGRILPLLSPAAAARLVRCAPLALRLVLGGSSCRRVRRGRLTDWREPCNRTLTNEPMTPEALVEEFTASLPYQLDDFQLEAIRALANRHSVLVAAPTGTGKTIIGQFGIFMARKYNTRAIYTTPIKALSNQKFRDFRARWGDDQVGLLTGDVVVNRDAPVLVMTTEVLRNALITGRSFGAIMPSSGDEQPALER